MKNTLLLLISAITFQLSAQVIPAMNDKYPTGTYKREQRVISKFRCPTAPIKDLQANMRTVGKAYVRYNPTYQNTTAEFTYTEISGIRREDGKVFDMGNPIEDKTEYAYKVVYNNEGRAEMVQGRDIYMNAVMNDNIHDLTEGGFFTYFLHNDKARNIGDTWVDSIFSLPLTEHIPMTYTFSKVEKTKKGRTAARIDITGDLEYNNHFGMILKNTYEMNLKGKVSGYMWVDMKTNRIYRIRALIELEGMVNVDGKDQPYNMEVKLHEWEMDPVGL